eukprot:gnl/MRDRNA2_/MRDRNA2_29559_c0_seq1.p1 gnl/MRDRNA2_/MRDRNA2_29559_c0~~gnl/MRDRNA2_/MRDRNA2_29559_c0_seq1.p1  ORF type:complete len:248 (-),score=31.81 gnl/MRDRNA2_/MRDRNA2_29559_c0_seq1:279-1022(-)
MHPKLKMIGDPTRKHQSNCNNSTIVVHILGICGNSHGTFQFDQSCRISQVKRKLNLQEDQRAELVFQDETLNDKFKLEDYGVPTGAILTVLVKARNVYHVPIINIMGTPSSSEGEEEDNEGQDVNHVESTDVSTRVHQSDCNHSTIVVHILDVGGNSHGAFEFDPSCRVSQVKEHLSLQKDQHADLVFQDKILNDKLKLDEYGIPTGATLTLVIKTNTFRCSQALLSVFDLPNIIGSPPSSEDEDEA